MLNRGQENTEQLVVRVILTVLMTLSSSWAQASVNDNLEKLKAAVQQQLGTLQLHETSQAEKEKLNGEMHYDGRSFRENDDPSKTSLKLPFNLFEMAEDHGFTSVNTESLSFELESALVPVGTDRLMRRGQKLFYRKDPGTFAQRHTLFCSQKQADFAAKLIQKSINQSLSKSDDEFFNQHCFLMMVDGTIPIESMWLQYEQNKELKGEVLKRATGFEKSEVILNVQVDMNLLKSSPKEAFQLKREYEMNVYMFRSSLSDLVRLGGDKKPFKVIIPQDDESSSSVLSLQYKKEWKEKVAEKVMGFHMTGTEGDVEKGYKPILKLFKSYLIKKIIDVNFEYSFEKRLELISLFLTKEGADKDLILGVLSRLQKNADYLNATVIRHVRDRGRVLYAMERVLESAQKARYAKIGPLFFDRNLKVEGVAKAITQFVQEQREAFQGINKDFHLKNSLALKESSLSQQRFLEYEMQTSIENFVDLSQASYSGKSKMQLKMELRKISVALGDLLKAVKALRKSYRQQFAAQQREAHKEILNYLIQEHPKVLRIMGKSPELYIYSF